MDISRADRLSQAIFQKTAPSDFEKRKVIMSLLRELSAYPHYLDRLERMSSSDLMSLIEELYRKLPLQSIDEIQEILDGDHEDFIWKPKSNHYHPQESALQSIREVRSAIQEYPSKIMTKLCYIQLVTILEAYLGDRLKMLILQNNKRIANLLQHEKELKKEKIHLHTILLDPEYPVKRANEYLSNTTYHNLPKTIGLYRIALGADISFPSATCRETLLKSVKKRHDLVHRNGFAATGYKLTITTHEIECLAENVELWITHIERTLACL